MNSQFTYHLNFVLIVAALSGGLNCVQSAQADAPRVNKAVVPVAHGKDLGNKDLVNKDLAGSDKVSRGRGWDTVQKLVKTFKSTTPADDNKGQGKIDCVQTFPAAADLIDFGQIASRSVGKSQWQTLSSTQKEDLTATIKALVQNRYYPRWQKIFGKGDVTYVSQSRSGGDLLVNTNLRLGHKDEPLVWQLSGDLQKPKVISLGVNDKDLLTKLSNRIQAHESKGGYKAMIAWLKGKGKCDTADSAVSGSGSDAMTAAKPADLKGLKTSSTTIDLID